MPIEVKLFDIKNIPKITNPLASWVCITFNRPELLNELLYCFLAQDYGNKELIILNDQKDVKYIYDDPRVKIYNLDERFKSLGAKREYSRKLTRGEYVFITDDDDIYYSIHISKLLAFHLENPEYDIVSNHNMYYTESNINLKTCHQSVAFNGACIKKEYWKNKKFNTKISGFEDVRYIENAKILKTSDDLGTFLYRKKINNTINISEFHTDGCKIYDEITKNTLIGETKTITLIPQISEKVKSYYE